MGPIPERAALSNEHDAFVGPRDNDLRSVKACQAHGLISATMNRTPILGSIAVHWAADSASMEH